ncbi:sterile alpha motif-like domain-containing protein [Staphylococcus arlettae]|uniref:sterile alpha motif-like domain-containing protein n=1 Tax=Staphylococcus arlettae TaxID=29378 RepID=UPI0021CE7312|nr:sterile alpha motif-like domain-containing protein [Staphylococcus arlettae]
MSFYKFIRNFTGDNTPLGELADLVSTDADFPINVQSKSEILVYFSTSPYYNNKHLEIVKRAFSIYFQTAKS